jgi:hypothetical protein
MLKINASTYSEMLIDCYKTKDPLFIAGPPGIGKSEIPRQVFSKLAKKKGLEFVRWDKTTKDEKQKLFDKPEKYFVFCDQRLSQMDTTDLRGIPKLTSDMLEPIPPSWIVYFCNPKAQGIIFFDEMNLAAPIVTGSAYQIIHDRSMSDMKLSDEVYLIAAGNRAEDKAYTFEMPLPLRDRFCEAELFPDTESWTSWASKENVNPHLIAFINWKESYLFRISETGADKSTTPRGIARASRLIGTKSITNPKTNMLVSISCGEAFATEFQAYVKYFEELDWNDIFDNPSLVKNMEVNKLFAVSGGLAEHFSKDLKNFDKIIEVVHELREEFAVMCLRFMREGNKVSFRRRAAKSQRFLKDLAPKLSKFVRDDE